MFTAWPGATPVRSAATPIAKLGCFDDVVVVADDASLSLVGEPTLIRLSTLGSIQVTPSTTGRSRSGYMPGAAGARTRKVNEATPPGATLVSFWIATRSAAGQPRPRALAVLSSPSRPRLTCCFSTPRDHVRVPVFATRTVSVLDSPGSRLGC